MSDTPQDTTTGWLPVGVTDPDGLAARLADVDYLADRGLTTPVICSRRRGESPSPVMQHANAILKVLVENRRSGRYP